MVSLNAARALAESPENKTTAGVDKDQNGIRDEVDALIAKEYQATPAQTKAAQNLARILQITAQSGEMTRPEALVLANKASDAIGCFMSATSEEKMSSQTMKLIDFTFNTAERQKNDRRYSTLLSGQAFTIKDCK